MTYVCPKCKRTTKVHVRAERVVCYPRTKDRTITTKHRTGIVMKPKR